MSLLKPSALAVALGSLASCSPDSGDANQQALQTPGTEAVPPRADTSLTKLRSLQVLQLGDLIVQNPSELYACYSPCPGSEGWKQSDRLGKLATTAETAATKAAPTAACDDSQIAGNLEALRALKIVQVGDLIRETAANNPRCYNVPCPEDVAKAKAVTCERAGKLANIAQDAKGL